MLAINRSGSLPKPLGHGCEDGENSNEYYS